MTVNAACIGDKNICIYAYGSVIVKVLSSNIINSTVPIIFVQLGELVLGDNTTFYGNSNPIYMNEGNLNISGHVVFENNRNIDGNGSTINLWRSKLYINRSTVLFYANIADNGGAIFVDQISTIFVNQMTLEFVGNTALSYGGAVYVDLSDIDNCSSSCPYSLFYIYNVLINVSVYNHNSAAKGGNYAYFNLPQDYPCNHSEPFDKKKLFSSSLYRVSFLGGVKATVNKLNYYKNHTLLLWPDDLEFQVVAVDYFNNNIGPVNGSLSQ